MYILYKLDMFHAILHMNLKNLVKYFVFLNVNTCSFSKHIDTVQIISPFEYQTNLC